MPIKLAYGEHSIVVMLQILEAVNVGSIPAVRIICVQVSREGDGVKCGRCPTAI